MRLGSQFSLAAVDLINGKFCNKIRHAHNDQLNLVILPVCCDKFRYLTASREQQQEVPIDRHALPSFSFWLVKME